MILRPWIPILLVMSFILCPWGQEAHSGETVQSLVAERSATIWQEGQILDDLILGARAKWTFVLVDGKLSERAWKDSETPSWIRDGSGAYGTDLTRKKTLFIVRVETKKTLRLEPSMIVIGDHALTVEDIVTNKAYVPIGEVPPGVTASFAVAVPSAAVKGKKIPIAVGEYSTELEKPNR